MIVFALYLCILLNRLIFQYITSATDDVSSGSDVSHPSSNSCFGSGGGRWLFGKQVGWSRHQGGRVGQGDFLCCCWYVWRYICDISNTDTIPDDDIWYMWYIYIYIYIYSKSWFRRSWSWVRHTLPFSVKVLARQLWFSACRGILRFQPWVVWL